MDENILREAVELATGWEISQEGAANWGTHCFVWLSLNNFMRSVSFDSLIKEPVYIAALASQLISQVEVAGRIRVEANTGFTAIRNCEALKDGHTPMWVDIVAEYGPNRDENSIVVCVEFLRGLKEKT